MKDEKFVCDPKLVIVRPPVIIKENKSEPEPREENININYTFSAEGTKTYTGTYTITPSTKAPEVKNEVKYIQCRCGNEIVRIEKDEKHLGFNFSLYESGCSDKHFLGLPKWPMLWERIKYAFWHLRTGRIYTDCVLIDYKEAEELSEFLKIDDLITKQKLIADGWKYFETNSFNGLEYFDKVIDKGIVIRYYPFRNYVERYFEYDGSMTMSSGNVFMVNNSWKKLKQFEALYK